MSKKIVIHTCGCCPNYRQYNDRFMEVNMYCKKYGFNVEADRIHEDCELENN